MERPRANIEQPVDEYDHELTPVQADAIALAEELLTHKEADSPVTFVDIVLPGDQAAMLAEIEAGPLSHLLATSDEQLAQWSDGERYPTLDMRKEIGEFTGMSLRVWGWDYDKIRHIKVNELVMEDGEPKRKPKRSYVEYPGEKDKVRQIEVSMGYRVGNQTVNEQLSIYVSSMAHDYIYASSQLSMPAYAEQGYEGHGGKEDDTLGDEAIEWFLEFVARHVGDNPKSYGELMAEIIQEIREAAARVDAADAVDELVEATWDAQALSLMRRRCRLLDNKTIAQGFMDVELASKAADALRSLNRQYRTYMENGKLDDGDEWVIRLGL